MTASRRSGKAKGKPKAKPRARPPSVVSETRAERKKRLERNERARERREEKRREEARLKRQREKKRAAKNARDRERRAALKKSSKSSKVTKGKPPPKKSASSVSRSASRAVEVLAKSSREAIQRATRNAKARERRARLRAGTVAPVVVAAGKPPSGYEPVETEDHPRARKEDLVTASMVAMVFREDLKSIALAIRGRHRTHVYQDTAEVTGAAWQVAPEDLGDVRAVIGGLGDAFQVSGSGIYYGETFYQGYATVVVSGGVRGRRKSDSPLNESRVGPDGKHYRTATTHWFRGDAQKCIATIGYMIANVMRGRPQFQLVKIGVRQYWSPIGRRPER